MALWTNKAYEYYQRAQGEEDYKEKLHTQFQFPKSGISSGFSLWLETYKWKVAFTALAASNGRPIHSSGVGASGFATIRKDPALPEDEFFIQGKVFQVRGRHSMESGDAQASMRRMAFAVKFSDDSNESPLDLAFSTGTVTSLVNLEMFSEFVEAMGADKVEEMKEFCNKFPYRWYATVQSNRRVPESFTKLKYYSGITYSYLAKDGVKRVARFRIIPRRCDVESGLLDDQDQQEPWNRGVRKEHEGLAKDYLSKEFVQLIENEGSIHYDLEIQIRDGDEKSFFNACVEWDTHLYAWRHLADVVLTTLLSEEMLEQTSFSIANRPSILSYPKPNSTYDFTSIHHVRERVYAAVQSARRARLSVQFTDTDNDISDYILLVKTGDMGKSGTDKDVYVALGGSKTRTSSVKLDKAFHDDFEKGQVDAYKISDRDIGEPRTIELTLKGRKKDDHAVDYVIVFDCNRKTTVEFPCYSWLSSSAIFQRGQASLCFKQTDEHLKNLRRFECQWRRKLFPWKKLPGLSSSIDFTKHSDLPRDVQFNDEKSRDFFSMFIAARIRFKTLGALMSSGFNDLDDYRNFANVCQKGTTIYDYFCDHWWDDVEFGRHFLAGTNPHHLQRCNAVPDNMPVTNEMVRDFLDRGETLEQEIKDGHVYMLDYKSLEGIPRHSKMGDIRYVAEPIALMYVRKSGHLVPIAIQLYQDPGTDNPIFLPSDDKHDWALAKTHLKCADSQIHQMYYHLARTHFIMEAVAVGVMRHLPAAHPLFKLLIPYLRHTIAINTIGRVALTGEGKVVDSTMAIGGGGHMLYIAKVYAGFHVDELFVKKDMIRRGVDDAEKLPNYHYRDDAYLMWDAIRDYVAEVTSLYYANDDDVVRDVEVNDWVADVRNNGYAQYDGHVDHGVPQGFKAKVDLDDWITMLIFASSCGHAAVNFSQMDYMAFVPNYPMMMRRTPPTIKGKANMKTIIDSLPDWKLSANALAAVFPLSQYSPEEVYLGEFPHDYFTETEPLEILAKFTKKMKAISSTIHKRNETRDVPYVYLLPERVPNSIAI